MVNEFYSKVFLDKEFNTIEDTSHYPNGLVSEDWRACVLLYHTLLRLDIPLFSLRLDYEPLEKDESGNIKRIKITHVSSATNSARN